MIDLDDETRRASYDDALGLGVDRPGDKAMSTKSAKIAAQIAALETAMAEAKKAERERMRARVIRVADQSGLLDVMIDSKALAQAFSALAATPRIVAAHDKAAAKAVKEIDKKEEESHEYN